MHFEGSGEELLAQRTRQALVVAKFPKFMRTEKDIRDTVSQDCLKNVLDLVEVRAEECLVDNKSGLGMSDFIFSIHENSLLASIRPWADGLAEDGKHSDLASTIVGAVRRQFTVLAEKHYPDGKNYLTYMYLVVQRRPRTGEIS